MGKLFRKLLRISHTNTPAGMLGEAGAGRGVD
jgi:hypothetical protein